MTLSYSQIARNLYILCRQHPVFRCLAYDKGNGWNSNEGVFALHPNIWYSLDGVIVLQGGKVSLT